MAADGPPPRLPSHGGPTLVALVLLLAACTPDGSGPSLELSPSAEAAGGRQVVVRAVATLSGQGAVGDRTYVDGIRLGERVVNRRGGIGGRPLDVRFEDDRGDPAATASLLREAVAAPGTAAALLVGRADAVVAVRPRIEASRTPVVLLAGDLYSRRGLFRQAFQTSVPLRWQAAVLARYLVRDRAEQRIGLVADGGPETELIRAALAAALAEEGAPLPLQVRTSVDSFPAVLRSLDAVVYAGGPQLGRLLVRVLRALADPPRLATFVTGLTASFPGPVRLPAGTVAPAPYTWAAWADPIRRVATFRDLCRRALGHPPHGFEQEGYDAVRLLAQGLTRADGHGGDPLLRALEAAEDELYSALPVALGPDDHLFLSDRQLGLFVVPGQDEDVEPFAPGWGPWVPLMRTFTTNGERTSIIDRDRDVFFPAWRPPKPAPNFWNSRYGIVTRRGDPLH